MPDDIAHDTHEPFPAPSGGSPSGATGTTAGTSSSGAAGDAGPSTTETAKDEAKNVATQAADSGGQVLDTAKAETSEVLSHAGQSARTLFEQVRGEFTDQAGTQQQRVAGGLHDLADELDRMGKNTDQPGMAASLVKQVSDRSRSTAEWMSQREPGDLVSEARRFAARKPGTFLAAAAALGFLGARLTRGLTASSASAETSTSGPGGLSAPRPAPAPQAVGLSSYDSYEVPATVPTVTTMSHGQPVTYPSGDAAAHPRLVTEAPSPLSSNGGGSDTRATFGGTGGAAEERP